MMYRFVSRTSRPASIGIVLITFSAGLLINDRASASETNDQSAPAPQSAEIVANESSPDGPSDASEVWVGVRLVPVPAALAAHLNLPEAASGYGQGIMVANVVTGGPADKAGLDRYDVIVSFDGQPVSADLDHLVAQMSACHVGQTVSLTVIRGGQSFNRTLTFAASETNGNQPAPYKHPSLPQSIWQDRIDFRGGVLRKGDEGWVWEEFDADGARVLDQLPDELRKHVEAWTAAGLGQTFAQARITRNGEVTELSRDRHGRIVVRRSRKSSDGVETVITRTYTNPEELARHDPDSYQLYESLVEQDEQDEEATGEPTAGSTESATASSGDTSSTAVESRQATAPTARIESEKYMWVWAQRSDRNSAEDSMRPADSIAVNVGASSQHQFRIEPNGGIEVIVREGENDLVLHFADEKELRAKRPALFEHYRQLVRSAD
jgi:hypothetical protein